MISYEDNLKRWEFYKYRESNMVDLKILVESIRRDVIANHKGAIGIWGLEKAVELFVGQKIMKMIKE